MHALHALFAAALLISPVVLAADETDTVAHWRFEEGPVGAVVEPPREDLVLDSSGNGNHLQTWAASTAPVYISETPFVSMPQDGTPNDFALNFAHGNHDLYTEDQPINSQVFSELTIEASFKINLSGIFQVIVGKDGDPVDGAPPIFLKVLPDSALELGMVDGSGKLRVIQSNKPLQPNVWYSAAATATAKEVALWLKRPGDAEYELEGTLAVEGLFAVEARHWTIGRGMWKGGVTDFFNGSIDEVRVSGVVLEPAAFLGVSPDSSIGRGTLLELSQLKHEGVESVIFARQGSSGRDSQG